MKDLFDFANHINISSLKEIYKVNWTDDQTTDITVTYKEGLVKLVSDYGGVETFSLQELYKKFYTIIKQTKWDKQHRQVHR